MFKRNKKQEEAGENACPYCGHENEDDVLNCGLCYYELNKSSREQGEAVDQETAGSIFDELTSDEDDSWQEGQSVEVQLNMDEVSIEVDQYEIVEIGEGDVESIEYMDAESVPESSETIDHQEVEIEKEILLDEETKDYQRFELGDHDFMGEIAEPVHMGRGKIVGGGESEDLPTEEELAIESTLQPETEQGTEHIGLPQLPDEDEIESEEAIPKGPPKKDTLLAEDDLIEAIVPVGPPRQTETPITS